jgi:hypothetical protein
MLIKFVNKKLLVGKNKSCHCAGTYKFEALSRSIWVSEKIEDQNSETILEIRAMDHGILL